MANPEPDYSRERYSGYSSQEAYQRDAKKHFDGEICGALTRTRKFCKKKPMENGRCSRHGGKSPKGLDHPRTKHGKYSKYLPEKMLEKYDKAENDADLMSMRSEVALLTSRIFELIEDIEDGAGRNKLREIHQNFERYKKAVHSGSVARDNIEEQLTEQLEQLARDTRIWDDITEMVDLKRKVVKSEESRMKTMSQYVETKQVMLLMTALMNIVTSTVEDLEGVLMDQQMIERTIKKIARKFENAANKNSSQNFDI